MVSFYTVLKLPANNTVEKHVMANSLHIEWLNKGIANWNSLQGPDSVHPDFRGVKFEYKNLTGANFRRANFQDAYLHETQLNNTILRGAYFRGAELSRANLEDADLSGAVLQGVNLTFANLRNAKLLGADIWGADLEGADLRGAVWTCCKKVDSAFEILNDNLGGTHDTQTFYRRLS